MRDEPQKPTTEEVVETDEAETKPIDKTTAVGGAPQNAVAEEYLNNWKRERADFLNYKKEEAKRMEEFGRFANEDVILETIEVVDDLELAVQEYKGIGLEQILKKFKDLFKKYGVEEIEIAGKFDPALHEAVETEAGGEKVIQVRAGYIMHSKVLRPARVKITK
ncbi:MAG: nucleotide exchange factor GrpE [Patescibacteria group bacterium]